MRTAAQRARLLIKQSNVTPPWVLAFWRILKSDAGGDYSVAWQLLPSRLNRGDRLPTVEEAVIVLLDHNLI